MKLPLSILLTTVLVFSAIPANAQAAAVTAADYQTKTEALLKQIFDLQKPDGPKKRQYLEITKLTDTHVTIKHRNLGKGWRLSVVNPVVGPQYQVAEGEFRKANGTSVFLLKAYPFDGYYIPQARRGDVAILKPTDTIVRGSLFKQSTGVSSDVSVSFISDKEYIKLGERVTLTWTSKNADTCDLYGAAYNNGNVADQQLLTKDLAAIGSTVLKPSVSMVYQLNCNKGEKGMVDHTPVFVN